MIRVSVILPVYKNSDTLEELNRRLMAVLQNVAVEWELLYVNDASPDESGEILKGMAAIDPKIRALHLTENSGQSAALLHGLSRASGDYFVFMDADLQDPPEAIPLLLEKVREGNSVVFAGRRGVYESRMRLLTSRFFKKLLSVISGLPPDAGLYLMLDSRMRSHLLSLHARKPFLLPMIASAGMPMVLIPVERSVRLSGFSAYSAWSRLALGLRGVLLAVSYRLLPPAKDAAQYNRFQREYFEGTEKKTMIPTDTPYLRRHVEEVLRFASLKDESRVLELGCGMGRYTLLFARKGIRVEGSDLSPLLLDRLREFSGPELKIPLHCFDIASPPPELEAQFDAVLGLFMLHHVHSLEDTFVAVRRLLKPGGQAVFLEPNPRNPLYYAQILITPRMKWKAERGMLNMRSRILFSAASAAGLSGFRESSFGFFPPFLANREWGAATERLLESIALWRRFLPFQLFAMNRLEETR